MTKTKKELEDELAVCMAENKKKEDLLVDYRARCNRKDLELDKLTRGEELSNQRIKAAALEEKVKRLEADLCEAGRHFSLILNHVELSTMEEAAIHSFRRLAYQAAGESTD